MSIPILAHSASPKIIRHSADFPPSFWGDRFLKYDSDVALRTRESRQEKVKELKEVVKREVFKTILHDDDTISSSKQLKVIDSVQRLGLSYHFEKELENAMEHMYNSYEDHVDKSTDLHDVSLRFRLLRQHGFYVSSGVFEKFKDEMNGNSNNPLLTDIPTMLALYEASHMRTRGEDILDEALVVTTTNLESILATSSSSNKSTIDHLLASQISCALKRPIRKSLHRLHARQYISFYQHQDSHVKSLLELAKLDFNLLQDLHKEELSDVLRWSKEQNLTKKLPYIRNKIELVFITTLGVYYEPKYRLARNILAKATVFVSVIDDTFDSYGTFEELELFTKAIQRWDISYKDQLPDYMQLLYQTLLKTYQEIEELVPSKETYRVHYAQEMLKILTKAYLEEARWFHQKHTPTLEEYLSVSLVTSSISMLTAIALAGIEDFVSNDVYEWLFSDPKILRASNTIGRLMNDIISHKFEQKRGHAPSSVECYRKQHMVSEQEAYNELNKIVENAWTDINQEILTKPMAIPMIALNCFDNIARVVDLLYRDGDDSYTLGGQEISYAVSALFQDEVP